ncbi:glycosyl transferase, group 1 [Geotalea uraniireducens Rf4]|uniref:Glycosyl transferase, group 1 n=1 Tax=Geotalea uraniireducens (strain Rf4) TaxID=351605 RepID=A5GEN7_GEOUR|nr:glycosyl transferase, group 1 [Geotalea uraniireducens Rf4]
MRILMLTQWFDPEPTFKGLPFAKELAKRGHQVEVLTGFPNYPGGEVYDGYRIRPMQRETMDGISVLRVPLYPSHDTSALGRIANYGSFALSSAILGVLLAKPVDLIYVYHPPATVGLSAIALSFFRRVPFVYDIQDLWPDTLAATGMLNNGVALRMIAKLCSHTYRLSTKIVVLSPGFRKQLIARGVPAEKIEVIYNWCDEGQIRDSAGDKGVAQELALSERFSIVFAGTMGKAQGLDAVLDAAALIAGRYSEIQFVFVGGGIEVDRLKKRAKDESLINVKFLPRRPVSEIGPVLKTADVLLVHLKDAPLFNITIPSKIQAYMAAGRPILVAVRGDAADLVEKANAGMSCIPEDSESIAAAVEKLYAMPRNQREELGENGRKFYERELSLRAGVGKFEDIFLSVVRKQ